ncbi:MAG: phosphate transport system regulatory protein PhoU, partial [Chthoniobacterales bacterium]|nr:phosphate transport system regulatory protein PhoU [Chthoniobacterales bacterium]
MVRSLLDQEIRQLREKLLEMGSLVETAIDRAVTALKNRDAALAQNVVEGDEQINRLRHEIEELSIETIATQQPMAIDLRMIFAITHIAVELERMGDHAAGIAKLVLRIADQPLLKPLIDIPLMAKTDREMIFGALDAFVKQ